MNLYYLNINKICNSNCLFCAADYEDRSRTYTTGNQYITAEQFQNILNVSSVKIGDRVILNGGEPTLNCELINMINYCNQMGVESYLFTNGRKFKNYEFAKKIVDSGVDKVTIPIYGHAPELHDSITRCIGSFQETVMGLKHLNILRKSHSFALELKILICMNNYAYIRSIAEYLLRNFKFDILLVSGLIPSDIAVKNKQVVPKELHRKAINDFFDFWRESKRHVILILDGIPICHLDDKSRITYLLQRKLNSLKPYAMIENCYYIDVGSPSSISSSSEITNWNKPICEKSKCLYHSICRLNTLLNHTNFLKGWIS